MVAAFFFASLLAASIAGTFALVVQHRFRKSPEYLWRQRVIAHSEGLAEQRRRLAANAPPAPNQVVEQERRAAKERLHRAIPVIRTMEQPGIGPGAIELLQQAGVAEVPTILRAHLERIHGIGPQKAGLLENAARCLIAECDSAFDARTSQEGLDFAVKAVRLRQDAQMRWDRHVADLKTVDSAVNRHRESERMAAQVDVWHYWREQPIVGLDRGRMDQPFATPHPLEKERAKLTESPSPIKAVRPPRRATVSFRLAWAAEFGMFLVLHGGKGRNDRMRRLQSALKTMFAEVPGSVTFSEDFDSDNDDLDDTPFGRDKALSGAIVVEVNRHLKPDGRADDWFASLLDRRLTGSDDLERLVDAVLASPTERSDDEVRLATWIDRRLRTTNDDPIRSPPVRQEADDSKTRFIRSTTSTTDAGARFSDSSRRDPVLKARSRSPSLDVNVDRTRPTDLLQELIGDQKVSSPPLSPKSTDQRDRLEAFTRFGVLVALADGRAAQAELRVVRQFLAEVFGQDPDLVRRFDPLIELCTVSRPHEAPTVGDAMRLAAGPKELSRLHRWATAIADASSGRNEREAGLLVRIAETFGLESSQATPQPPDASASKPSLDQKDETRSANTSLLDPRDELEIPRDAEVTVELVRRRFHLASDRLDVSRLGELGVEFAKLAKIKRERLQEAARSLLEPLGAPLEVPSESAAAAEMRHNPDLDAMFGA